MKIKYKLVPFERAVAFQILEMDERFRCIDGGEILTFTDADSGFSVISEGSPGLLLTTICLRGSVKDEDHAVSLASFQSNSERDEYISNLFGALLNWSHEWPGFKPEIPKPEVPQETHVITLLGA